MVFYLCLDICSELSNQFCTGFSYPVEALVRMKQQRDREKCHRQKLQEIVSRVSKLDLREFIHVGYCLFFFGKAIFFFGQVIKSVSQWTLV